MAANYKTQTINSLIRENLDRMIREPVKWTDFLTSRACRNYGLRFDQILSIYSLDPEAGECATYEAWQKCGRPVRHGIRGLPVLSGDGNEIKYYYPIKTTVETEKAVKLFRLGRQHTGIIGRSYEISQADYRELYICIKEDLSHILDEEKEEHDADWKNLMQGIKITHPSGETEPEAWTSMTMYDLIQKSAALIVSSSLETDPGEADLGTDFDETIRQLDTDKLIIVGTMAVNCARKFLVRCKQLIKEEMKNREDKGENGLDDRAGRGNSGADLRADRDNIRDVRDEKEGISAGDGAGDVRGTADPGPSGSPLRDDRRTGEGDGGIDHQQDDGNGRDNGRTENTEPDGMDTSDQYDQGAGAGDRADRDNTEGTVAELTENDEVQKTVRGIIINEVIRTGTNEPDSLKRIVARIIKDCGTAELAGFIKNEYLARGCMKGFQVGGERIAVNADDEGLHIGVGRSAHGDGAITTSYYDVAGRIIDMYRTGRFITSSLYTKQFFVECLHLDLEDVINKIYSIFPLSERSVLPWADANDLSMKIFDHEGFQIVEKAINDNAKQGGQEDKIREIMADLSRIRTLDVTTVFQKGRNVLLPSFVTDDQIREILQLKFDDIRSFAEKQGYFGESGYTITPEFLRSLYGEDAGTVKITGGQVIYSGNGIEIINYGPDIVDGPRRLIDWNEAAGMVSALLNEYQNPGTDRKDKTGTITDTEEKESVEEIVDEPPEYEQLSIFDIEPKTKSAKEAETPKAPKPSETGDTSGNDDLTSEGTVSLSAKKPAIPYDEVDHLLRFGSNTDSARLRIAFEFSKDKPLNEKTEFLRGIYHGGFGLNTDSGKLAAWYSEKGIRISKGTAARYDNNAEIIPWEEAASRIDIMLAEGRFVSGTELAEADDHERSRIALSLLYLFHDLSDEAREKEYFSSLETINGSGYPDETQSLAEALADPVFLARLTEEYGRFREDYKADRELLRFNYYDVDGIQTSLRELALPRREFVSALIGQPEISAFITEDEIDAAIGRGSGFKNGKIRIYEFFIEPHTDKEKADFLKKEYGIGGRSHALSGDAYSQEDHDSRGLRFKKKNCLPVELSWNKVEKRIDTLIQDESYLSAEEQAEYDAIRDAHLGESELRTSSEAEPEIEESKKENVSDINPGSTREEPTSRDDEKTNEAVPGQEPAQIQDVLTKEGRGSAEVSETAEMPQISVQNYHISEDQYNLITPRQKYQKNVEAIRLLKQIESEQRNATPEEQGVLAGYSGWGGLPKVFEVNDNRYAELKGLLTEDEYRAARASSLTSFYTDPLIINSIYGALSNLGFSGGNILEPCAGIGNFFGMLPENMERKSRLYGVELDSISGRIATRLYPNASIQIKGYEDAELPDNFYDVAIGNVPFGQYKVSDKKYDKENWLIHDYFFGKTLDKLRPGGICAFITSKGTMDKKNSSVRRYLAERAEFLGAIRLPDNAFRSAGTQVTSDIIFLKKRSSVDKNPDDTWITTAGDENNIEMNRYFVDHPDMCLGTMTMETTAYGLDSTCKAREGDDLGQLLSGAVQKIYGEYDSPVEAAELDDGPEDERIPADPNVRNYSYTIIDGKLYFRTDSVMYPAKLNSMAEERARNLITLRDITRKVIRLQLEGYADVDIDQAQHELNKAYDSFVGKYGRINDRANRLAFGSDESYYLLSSLEILDSEGKFKDKAAIFYKRTIKRHTPVSRVSTAGDAFSVCLSDMGKVDLPYMSSISGLSVSQIKKDLEGIIFKNIGATEVNDEDTEYVSAEEYLSGNVREKLRWAQQAMDLGDTEAEINVNALATVIPKDLTATEINVRLGATWIPVDVVQDFVNDITDGWGRQKVIYIPQTGEWRIGEKKNVSYYNVNVWQKYGSAEYNAFYIIEDTLNLRDCKITYYDHQLERTVVDAKATRAARAKQDLVKETFRDWIWKDPQRRSRLVQLYNERFNAVRPRAYDGSYLTFDGINTEIKLKKHQVDAVARIIGGGNSLLAHCVGAGKTYEMTASVQEMKRLGLCRKAMIVVPNHLTEQWGAEYLHLYPGANILVASKKDFETKNRKKFCSKIATGDYDAVIIGHSQFEKIPMSVDSQKRYYQQQVDELVDAIQDAKSGWNRDNITIKKLEAARKRIEARLERLNNQERKDNVINFEELGIDRLFIDEAHYFKNLAAFTKMQNVAGISSAEAQKSQDLFMKCRYMDDLTGRRGVIFATGTPISNSMTEMYTMQKYLQYDTLDKLGLLHFDSWASTFGETKSEAELNLTGNGFRVKTRFSRFYNLPELTGLFRQVADVQTADTLNLPVPECERHTITLEPSDEQMKIVDDLSERAERVHSRGVDPTEDNMLKITNDGRKLALDQRLFDPSLPGDPNNKINACAGEVFRIWQETGDKRLTQMIFCDLSTPSGDWNVYKEMKTVLMEMGIPPEEIAFIHDAKTDVQKEAMFQNVREGKIRVIMGSTAKMGAGTNCQDKLFALHHLDCPWRPSDLQQQEGRILRQGNDNELVHIYNYVTKGTFDAYMYQLVEQKQRFIGQIITSRSPAREANDVDAAALNYAEIKACCTGNPLIKEKMDLDNENQKLSLRRNLHYSQQYDYEDLANIKIPAKIKTMSDKLENVTKDLCTVSNYDIAHIDDGNWSIRLQNVLYNDKKEAGELIGKIEKKMSKEKKDKAYIGSYRGLRIAVEQVENPVMKGRLTMLLSLEGNEIYTVKLPYGAMKIIDALDGLVGGIEQKKNALEEGLTDLHNQLENAKAEIGKPFPEEERLKEIRARLAEVNAELELDKSSDDIIDEPDSLDEGEIITEERKRKRSVC